MTEGRVGLNERGAAASGIGRDTGVDFGFATAGFLIGAADFAGGADFFSVDFFAEDFFGAILAAGRLTTFADRAAAFFATFFTAFFVAFFAIAFAGFFAAGFLAVFFGDFFCFLDIGLTPVRARDVRSIPRRVPARNARRIRPRARRRRSGPD